MIIRHTPHFFNRNQTTDMPAALYPPLLVLVLALVLAALLPAAVSGDELNAVTISGYVRASDGAGLEGVSVYGYYSYGYPSVTTTTDTQGYYQLEFPLGQSGSVGVCKHLYTFEPNTRYYSEPDADVTGADYTAIRCTVISGHIGTAGGTPVQYAQVDPLYDGQLDSTDENGFYQVGVPSGWTGTIRVTKPMLRFDPPEKFYENVTADLTDQDIEAIPYKCISGYVKTAAGEPVEGVIVRTPDIWSDYEDYICYTDADGYYCLRVPPGWSGRMYAEKWTYLFEPTTKTYDDVTSDIPGQNYTAIPFRKISGHVRTADGTPVEGVSVLSHNEHGSGSGAITDANGYYSVSVPPGWSGGIEVYTYSKPFSFDPAERIYENVTEDLTGQDILAIPFVQISGYVRTPEGTPISDATVYSDASGRVYTDTNGCYSVLVPREWSGTIDVDKPNYKIEPEYRTYENVTSALSDQNFTALSYLTIQGTVRTPDGKSLAAYISASYDGVSAVADDNGNYTCLVPPGWSGSLTAQRGLYVFEPDLKTYENVTSGLVDQDFTAVPYVTISGYVETIDGQPLEGVSVRAQGGYSSEYTDSDGYYVTHVPPGWSGSISVDAYQYAFTPATTTYQNVTTDQTGQNFTAAPYRMISGSVRMADGSPVVGASILYSNNGWAASTDSNGYYSFGVPPGWSGNVNASGSFLAFEPASKSYSNVQADISGQDYTATQLYKISGYIHTASGEKVETACVRASGVTQEAYVDYYGRYEIGVPPGWSGIVTPQGWFYEMEPESRSYTNVGSDLSDQDYTATPVSKSLADIKKSPDGTFVICPSVHITGCFDDCIYVGTATHDFGIKVCCPGTYYSPGYRQYITGFVSTDSNNERCIIPCYMVDLTYQTGSAPIYMSNRSIGGSDWFYSPAAGTGQQGVVGSVGLNNIGLLVKTSGQIIEQGDGWFRISDGSGSGLRCILPGNAALLSRVGHVVVTGISSCQKNEDGTLQQVLRIKSQDDIVQE